MRYLVILSLLLSLAPVFAQPAPLSPYEAAMKEGRDADAQSQQIKALAAYKRAVAEAEKVPDHPEWLIQSLLKYGNLTMRAGNEDRDQLAEAIFTRALEVAEKTYGPEDTRIMEPLTELGWQHWRTKKYPEAEDCLLKAEAIATKALPADSTQLADARFALGGFYMGQANDKAVAFYRQALATYEKAYGPDHQRTLRTRLNLGNCLMKDTHYPEAQEQYQPVVDAWARVKPGGWEHSEALAMLSAAYIAQGQYDKAEPLELQVFAYAEQLMGKDSMSMSNYLRRLVKFFLDAGKAEKAEPYQQRLITLMTKPNAWQPALARTHEDYARLLILLKRQPDAAKEYKTAYDLYERWMTEITRQDLDTKEWMIPKFFHDEVPEYPQFLARYADFLRGQDQPAEADKMTARAKEISELLARSKASYKAK